MLRKRVIAASEEECAELMHQVDLPGNKKGKLRSEDTCGESSGTEDKFFVISCIGCGRKISLAEVGLRKAPAQWLWKCFPCFVIDNLSSYIPPVSGTRVDDAEE